jgi:perosamine synthetase
VRRTWFVYTVRLPAGADRDAVIADLDQRGISSKAYLPCIHLMPHYRERFGFRGGEFPVAEEASARSLALPFFGAMGEAEVDRVAEALAEALRGNWT